jgi:CelD/BcsL family acetyltransferase involved in cellulose biosynthesis
VGQADTIVHARAALREAPSITARASAPAQRAAIALAVHHDLAAIEPEWRRFEQTADCTPFQTFNWLSAWHRHVGTRNRVTPAVVTGSRNGALLFILPLEVAPGMLTRRLAFLGEDLCDYHAPLLAPDFSRIVGDGFPALWSDICALVQKTPGLRHDTIALSKMPTMIGAQKNPMLALDVQLNPSGAYETVLGDDWEAFYAAKRSSSTRRRDRTKVKRLGELGAVRFVNPESTDETARTLETLMEQKAKAFARMGVVNLFARPGFAEFYREIASAPQMRGFIHISRLDVGKVWSAANLGLTFRDCYYHILASYDDGEVSRFGPGAAHLRELLKFAIGRGLKRFDFTIGDESYKRDWCDSEQRLYDHSSAATLRGLPLTALSLGKRRVKRMIKKSAPLWNAVVKLRATLASLRKTPAPQNPEP